MIIECLLSVEVLAMICWIAIWPISVANCVIAFLIFLLYYSFCDIQRKRMEEEIGE